MAELLPTIIPQYMKGSIHSGIDRFSKFIGISPQKAPSWVKEQDYKIIMNTLNNFILHEQKLGTHALTINKYITAARCFLSLYAKDHLIQSVDDILYCEFRVGMTSIEEVDIELLSKAYDNQPGKIDIRNRAILKLCLNHSINAAAISRIKLSDYDADKKELKASVRKQKRIFSIEGVTLEALNNWLSIRSNQDHADEYLFIPLDRAKISTRLTSKSILIILLDAAKLVGINSDVNNIIRNAARKSRLNLKSELMTAIGLIDLMETSELVKKQIKRILKHVDSNID